LARSPLALSVEKDHQDLVAKALRCLILKQPRQHEHAIPVVTMTAHLSLVVVGALL
jgi:hypothetical protein